MMPDRAAPSTTRLRHVGRPSAPGAANPLGAVKRRQRAPRGCSRLDRPRRARFEPTSTVICRSVLRRTVTHGVPQHARLLLHAARVGDDGGGVALQREHVEVADRVDELDVADAPAAARSASRGRVRGCTGKQHRQPATSTSAPTICAKPLGMVGVLGPMDGGEHVLARLEAEALRRTVAALDTRATLRKHRLGHDVADEVDAVVRRRPRATRFVSAPSVGVSSIAESWSVTRRLTSSGIDMSPLRSPASRCTTGTAIFAAASAPASVEFTSPTTSTRVGRLGDEQLLERASSPSPVCTACVPDPTPRNHVGSGDLEVAEEDVGHRRVVVLAGVRDRRVDARRGQAPA